MLRLCLCAGANEEFGLVPESHASAGEGASKGTNRSTTSYALKIDLLNMPSEVAAR